MPTYENMYYYLEHSIREALQDLEQQNFGAAKKTLTQAREVTEKMRRVIVGKNDVYDFGYAEKPKHVTVKNG